MRKPKSGGFGIFQLSFQEGDGSEVTIPCKINDMEMNVFWEIMVIITD